MERIERLLQIHFAVLTAIGGLLLTGGEVGMVLPAIAVVAAIVSHLLVDRWQIIALPTTLAYIGMGIVAAYCMTDFLITPAHNQLAVVANLLVLVVVVLLFQRKSIRVFEQIGVFCLLELVVAAVFNSAILFGLMLVPFALVGMRAMVLLQTISTLIPMEKGTNENVRINPSETLPTPSRRSIRLVRFGVTALTPPVLLVTAIFFYALPRASGGNDGLRVGGHVTTGFSKTLTLDQVGELLSNRDLVMRVQLTNRRTGSSYQTRDPLYLRGQTLSVYEESEGTGLWGASDQPLIQYESFLPMPYEEEQRERRILYDDVKVEVDLQPLTTPETLFAIAPYYSSKDRTPVYHLAGDWLLRRSKEPDAIPGRFNYEFGTHAFSNGVQTKFLRMFSVNDYQFGRVPTLRRRTIRELTNFSSRRMPTIAAEAERIAATLEERAQWRYDLARAIEAYLAESGQFTYTTSLTEKRDRTVDPIEEFVANYRRGHCQYFASAMVMMLRSQGVPARIVAGYRSDEFNSIGDHYIVRQLHAHTWVEVLLEEDQVPLGARLAGQPERGLVLARFDPTPSDDQEPDARASIEHFYDFAQSLWNSYVLDMSGDQQEESLFGSDESAGVSDAYSRAIKKMRGYIQRLNASELGAGALAENRRFSWRAAIYSIIVALVVIGLYQTGLLRRMKWRWGAPLPAETHAQKSEILFYQEMCDQLETIHVRRRSGQTPQEFADQTAGVAVSAENPSLLGQSLRSVIDYFYQLRYGNRAPLTAAEQSQIDESLQTITSWTQRTEYRGSTDARHSEKATG